MTDAITHRKTLGQKDMVLFTVSAILLLDTLAAAASVGASAITWWLLLGIIFLAPFALICAEMGCAYPEQGGIYAWVRDAFGRRWASRATWGYWVNTAVWVPAIYILFAGIYKQLFDPDLSLVGQITIGIVLTWVAVAVNVITLNVGKWIPNLGAILKVVIFVAIVIGGFLYTQNHGMANPLTFETLKPDWGSSLQYIPAIIYGMLGFELVSAGSDEMKNPARDVPRSIFISAIVIIALYVLGTTAVLAAIPSADINLVEGLMDTLNLFFGGSDTGKLFALTLGVAALFTFFSNGVTWAMGCNRAAAEAANEGELPRFFGIESKTRGTPVGAAILMGIVSTLTLSLYGFMAGSNEDLFWSLFAFSAVIFLLPYQGMLLAFVKMRITDPEHPRPYKIPGGLLTARILAYTCMAVLALSIVLFVYTPGEGIQWPVLIGVIVTLAIGEMVIRSAEGHRVNSNPLSHEAA
ncbi:APC family permease [Pseudomaricurvus alkylphenolicus]|jgi:amino acid transporter|uniref:APC family permease n=1 Tax=Pseudomaricurvus alkylphenolicus TaxID=1306991 RepID=UPI0014248DC3|nr:APC family permease [Pseudomaricurvus alkylphenolicus]NIB40077.1 APC family permease [Pseudomaricurvus alkylphenolicus]